MLLTLFEKIGLVFKTVFSSFASVELFIIILLLFSFLVINAKVNNKIVKYGFLTLVVGFIIGVISFNTAYAGYCFDYLLKCIMSYIYFPSTVIYFLIVILATILVIISVFSKKISVVMKCVYAAFFSFIYLLFFNFILVIIEAKLDLADKVSLYQNNTVLSIVQISNLVFVIWLLVILFYKLFIFFKKKYD